MQALVLMTVIFLAALILFLALRKAWIALLVPSLIAPTLILYEVFFLPYQGGGASFWPIGLAIGSTLGLISSALGVGVGVLIKALKRR